MGFLFGLIAVLLGAAVLYINIVFATWVGSITHLTGAVGVFTGYLGFRVCHKLIISRPRIKKMFWKIQVLVLSVLPGMGLILAGGVTAYQAFRVPFYPNGAPLYIFFYPWLLAFAGTILLIYGVSVLRAINAREREKEYRKLRRKKEEAREKIKSSGHADPLDGPPVRIRLL